MTLPLPADLFQEITTRISELKKPTPQHQMKYISISSLQEAASSANSTATATATATPTQLEFTKESVYDLTEFCKSWGKLDKQQKINRAMAYAKSLTIVPTELTQLKTLLISAINERKITRKTDVDYDETRGVINKILELHKNADGKYYLGKEVSKVTVSSTSNIKIAPLKTLDLTKIKIKPIIKAKVT